MAVQLNHTIVPARDKAASARFLSELLDLPAPTVLEPFAIVQVGETSLDFVDSDDEISSRHFAFLVTEAEFDRFFGRIQERRLPFWADPGREHQGEINRWDGGRGVYFDDPDGHLLELITRPYGTGGTTSDNPHPLVS